MQVYLPLQQNRSSFLDENNLNDKILGPLNWINLGNLAKMILFLTLIIDILIVLYNRMTLVLL